MGVEDPTKNIDQKGEKKEVVVGVEQENNPEKFKDEKYWERRNLIETSDNEIIRSVMSEGGKGHDFQDKTMSTITNDVLNKKSFYSKYFKDKTLIDIGCGKEGNFHASWLIGFKVGIKDVVLVDPYIDIDLKERPEIADKVSFEKKDGLSFLLERKTSSGNVITSSIDFALIQNDEYHKRLAQEIYRVTPENGFFISANSPEIEAEARQLFAYVKGDKMGIMIFFKKKKEEIEADKNRMKNDWLNFIKDKVGKVYSKEPALKHFIDMITGAFDLEDEERKKQRIKDYCETLKILVDFKPDFVELKEIVDYIDNNFIENSD